MYIIIFIYSQLSLSQHTKNSVIIKCSKNMKHFSYWYVNSDPVLQLLKNLSALHKEVQEVNNSV